MRGAKQKTPRRARDNYPTPPEAAEVLPALLDRHYPGWEGWGDLLEPAAGHGNLLRAFSGRALRRRIAVELDAACRPDLEQLADLVVCPEDFRFYTPPPAAVVPANPPYSLSFRFLRKVWASFTGDGPALAAFLLPLSFLESKGRRSWMQSHPLTGLAVFADRPSFTGDGGTDAVAYAWMIWAYRTPSIAQWIEVI